MNLFVCLWNAPEAWRMAALDAVKRMSDVLPQLSAHSAQQFYRKTKEWPIPTRIPSSPPSAPPTPRSGDAPTWQWTGPTWSCTTVRLSIPRVNRRVVGQRARWSMGSGAEPSGRAVRPRSGHARSLQVLTDPSASTRSSTGSVIGHGSSATASRSFALLHASGAGIRSASAWRPSPAGRGQTHADCEHPGHARRRGLEHAVRRGRPDQAPILRPRGAGSVVAGGEQPCGCPRAGADPARGGSSRQRPRRSPAVRVDRQGATADWSRPF